MPWNSSEDYTKAIEIDPNYGAAYLPRRVMKGMQENVLEAIQDLQTPLRLAKQGGDENLEAEIEEWIQEIARKKMFSSKPRLSRYVNLPEWIALQAEII